MTAAPSKVVNRGCRPTRRWPSSRRSGDRSCLQRLADPLPLHHRRRRQLQHAVGLGLDVAEPVDRLAQRVDDPAEEVVADRQDET
jgi:hypothetical protein